MLVQRSCTIEPGFALRPTLSQLRDVACLPTLTIVQVHECLAYYEDHRGEIDLLVARQMAHAHEQL